VRYADGPEWQRTIDIDAPPERVWEICTDLPGLGRWSPENEGGEWLDDPAGPALGARFRGRNRHPAAGRWETTSVVTECDPPRHFAFAVGDPANPGATWSFTLEREGAGTRLQQRVRMGPGPSGATAAIERMPDKEERIIARRLEEYDAGMQAVLEGIKAAAEGA
jgi:uncharacterized protein YndB with AHSA1/START domain